MKEFKLFGKSIQIEGTATCDLYKVLRVGKYTQYPCEKQSLEEDMICYQSGNWRVL